MLSSQVKVSSWINGKEESEVVGISARFGKPMESRAREAQIYTLEAASPTPCCNLTSNQVKNHLHNSQNNDGIRNCIFFRS